MPEVFECLQNLKQLGHQYFRADVQGFLEDVPEIASCLKFELEIQTVMIPTALPFDHFDQMIETLSFVEIALYAFNINITYLNDVNSHKFF